MFPEKLVPRGHIALPVLGEPLEIYERRRDASRSEERHGVLEVLVEVGVEDALIHEVRVPFDFEQQPAQVVQFERRKNLRSRRPPLSQSYCRTRESLLRVRA